LSMSGWDIAIYVTGRGVRGESRVAEAKKALAGKGPGVSREYADPRG
jgi:hypothetical protein